MTAFSFNNVLKAYKACKKHKGNALDKLRFEHRLIDNIWALVKSLNDKSYKPSKSHFQISMLN